MNAQDIVRLFETGSPTAGDDLAQALATGPALVPDLLALPIARQPAKRLHALMDCLAEVARRLPEDTRVADRLASARVQGAVYAVAREDHEAALRLLKGALARPDAAVAEATGLARGNLSERQAAAVSGLLSLMLSLRASLDRNQAALITQALQAVTGTADARAPAAQGAGAPAVPPGGVEAGPQPAPVSEDAVEPGPSFIGLDAASPGQTQTPTLAAPSAPAADVPAPAPLETGPAIGGRAGGGSVADALPMPGAQPTRQGAGRAVGTAATAVVGRVRRISRTRVINIITFSVVIGCFVIVFAGLAGMISIFGVALLLAALGAGYALRMYRDLHPNASPLTAGAADPQQRLVYECVAQCAERAGLPVPRTYLANDSEPNAFTLGLSPQGSIIIVNAGLLKVLGSDRELVHAVVAHEVGHIANGDSKVFTMLHFPVDAMQRTAQLMIAGARLAVRLGGPMLQSVARSGWIGALIALMALFAVVGLFFLAWMIAAGAAVCVLFLNWFGREREYTADEFAVGLAGSKEPVIELLRRLLPLSEGEKETVQALAQLHGQPEAATDFRVLRRLLGSPAFTLPFMQRLHEMVATHPSTLRRIARLESGEAVSRHTHDRIEFGLWVTAGGTLALIFATFGLVGLYGTVSVFAQAAHKPGQSQTAPASTAAPQPPSPGAPATSTPNQGMSADAAQASAAETAFRQGDDFLNRANGAADNASKQDLLRQAIAAYDRGLALAPNATEAARKKQLAESMLASAPSSASASAVLRDADARFEAANQARDVASKRQSLEQAIALYQQGLALDPNSPGAQERKRLAETMLQQLGAPAASPATSAGGPGVAGPGGPSPPPPVTGTPPPGLPTGPRLGRTPTPPAAPAARAGPGAAAAIFDQADQMYTQGQMERNRDLKRKWFEQAVALYRNGLAASPGSVRGTQGLQRAEAALRQVR